MSNSKQNIALKEQVSHYPFGMPMPGRSYTSENYRFGFNGMEKDDEMKGTGNSLDFGARIYDSRLGRWLSVDPLQNKYTWSTPYSFVANKPIVFIDPDGKIIKFNFSSSKAQASIMKYINELRNSSDRFNKIYEALDKSSIVFNVGDGAITKNSSAANFNQYTNSITFDLKPNKNLSYDGVAEEFFHAYQAMYYGHAELMDYILLYRRMIKEPSVRSNLKLVNAISVDLDNKSNQADAHWLMDNVTFIENEAKLFKYIALNESLLSSQKNSISKRDVNNSDTNSGGSVGQSFIDNKLHSLLDHIGDDIANNSFYQFLNWAKKYPETQGYTKGGNNGPRSLDALNSTSEPIWDTRPPTNEEIQRKKGES